MGNTATAQERQAAQPAPSGATAVDIDLDEILRMTEVKRSAVMGPPDDIEKVVILLAKAGGLDDIRRSLPQGSQTRAIRFLAGFVKCARQELVNRKGPGGPGEARLFRCSTASILEALKLAALVDVVPGDGRAYLIAYGQECKFELGAHGMRDVMRRSKAIKDVNDQVIYDGDEFEIELEGPARGVVHRRRTFGKSREWVAAYATVLLEGDPRPIVEIIDQADLEAIKSQAKAKNSLAWTTFADEMSRAKALRRISKRVPMRPDDAAALQAIDAANFLMAEAASEGMDALRRRGPARASINVNDFKPSTDPNRGHDDAAPTPSDAPETQPDAPEEPQDAAGGESDALKAGKARVSRLGGLSDALRELVRSWAGLTGRPKDEYVYEAIAKYEGSDDDLRTDIELAAEKLRQDSTGEESQERDGGLFGGKVRPKGGRA